MTAPRFDMYTLVHKGQRRTLFQLTLAAGQLGPEDAPAREAVVPGIRSFIDAVQEHADHEDTYLGPLHVEAGTATAVKLHADHAALKAELAAVQGRLVAAHRPHVVQYNLSTMLPAASSGERVRFLGSLKRTMPPPVFERVRGQIAALLEPREWAAIDAA